LQPLIVKKVWKEFKGRAVLKGVDLEVGKGRAVALVGPNGAGKSTLMKIIIGIYRPTKGEVKVFGKDPKEPEARERLGYSPQEGGLREELTGLENAEFYASLYGVPKGEVKKRLEQVLDRVGLSKFLNVSVSKYSGGMKRFLSLAIALIHEPSLLVLDEPTVGLDPKARKEFWKIIEEVKGEGKSVLFATHYMDEAETFADEVYMIAGGKIVAKGSPEELKRSFGPKGVIELEVTNLTEEIERYLRERYSYSIKGNVVRVQSEDPEGEVPELVSSIYRAGSKVKSLRISKPSLEDVFVRLVRGERLEAGGA